MDTAYIPYLSVNIFSVTRATTKGFNVTSEKETLILMKYTITLKFEERLYHWNGDGYPLVKRLYSNQNYTGEILRMEDT